MYSIAFLVVRLMVGIGILLARQDQIIAVMEILSFCRSFQALPVQKYRILNQSECVLNTGQTAIHSCVIYNQNTRKWKVLYFTGSQSGLWNPEAPDQVTFPQVVPNWPPPQTDPPNLFCSGHSFLPDGKLLVPGGHREPVIKGQFRGLRYTYIFDPISEQWSVSGLPDPPHLMADGRWYPTVTTLGAGQGFGKVIAMSGFRYDYDSKGKSVVNTDPEIYDPATGWSLLPPQAVQPFGELYPGAHVIPYGSYAGKVFYCKPMTQAYVFDRFFSGPPNGGHWNPVGQARSNHRSDGNSVLLPLLPGSTSAKVLILGGGNPALKTAETIDLASGTPTWSSVNSMFFARRNSNAIILPIYRDAE